MPTRKTAENNSNYLKPFVKWVGGKGQLLKNIQNKYPTGLGKDINKYAEPFVGGGAVLFDILNNYNIDNIYISDINENLINTYNTIKLDCYSLIGILKQLENEYISLNLNDRKSFYNNKREEYNNIQINKDVEKPNIRKAGLFIFLNKTCFNGLYRVNKKGLFNVPMGQYKNPCICDKENLCNISKALQKIIIKCADYKESVNFIDKHTFVYCDPPYRPLTKTSNFTSYTKDSFDDNSQIELSNFIKEIEKLGAKVVISNSDPKNTNDKDSFFDDLYRDKEINRITANRMINCNGNSRGKITELLISNF